MPSCKSWGVTNTVPRCAVLLRVLLVLFVLVLSPS
jgi:hypothetical protein